MKNRNIKISKSFYVGVRWKALSQIISISSKFITTLILARLLLPEDFGLFGIIQIFVALSLSIVSNTIAPFIIQNKKLTSSHIRSGNILSLMLGLFFFFLFWIGSYPISVFFNNSQLITLIKIFGFKFIFDSLAIIPISMFRREVDYKSIFFISFSSLVLGQGLISIILAFLKFGVYSLVVGSLSYSILLFLSSIYLYLKKGNFYALGFSKKEAKEIIGFGIWTTLTNIVNTGANRGDYFIIGKYLDNFALGIYTKAYYLMQLGSSMTIDIFSSVLFPVFSKIQEDKEKIKEFLLGFIPIISIFILSIMIFIFFYAKPVILLVLGEKWLAAVLPLKILSLFGIFRGLYKIFDSVILSLGKVKEQFIIHLLYMILVVLLSFLGLKWGLKGVSFGVGVSTFIIFILLSVYSSKRLNIKLIEWTKIAKPILIYSFFFIFSFSLHQVLPIKGDFIKFIFGLSLWFILWFFILVGFKLKFFNLEFYSLVKTTYYLYPDFVKKQLDKVIKSNSN